MIRPVYQRSDVAICVFGYLLCHDIVVSLLNYRLYHSWIELFELVFNDNKGVSEMYCFALCKKHVNFVYQRSSINLSMPIGIILFLSISLLVIYFESKGYLVLFTVSFNLKSAFCKQTLQNMNRRRVLLFCTVMSHFKHIRLALIWVIESGSSWSSFVMSTCEGVTSHWYMYPGSGVVLDCIDSCSLPSLLLYTNVQIPTKRHN